MLHGHACTPPPPPTGATPGITQRYLERPPSHCKHLCRSQAGWEGRSWPHRQFQGLPPLSPITLLLGRKLHLQVREQLPPNFGSGKLVAVQPASPIPLILVASQAPCWCGARQLCRAGEPQQRHLCFSCLPAASPRPWCDTYEVEPSFHPQQRFPGSASPQQDQVHHSPPFPRCQPRSRAGEPGAMEAGFGRYLLAQVFALIHPGAASHPHPCLSPKEPGSPPTPSPAPWGGKV